MESFRLSCFDRISARFWSFVAWHIAPNWTPVTFIGKFVWHDFLATSSFFFFFSLISPGSKWRCFTNETRNCFPRRVTIRVVWSNVWEKILCCWQWSNRFENEVRFGKMKRVCHLLDWWRYVRYFLVFDFLSSLFFFIVLSDVHR